MYNLFGTYQIIIKLSLPGLFMPVSNTRRISSIALFTALAAILNLIHGVPAPYAGFLIYDVWEIPIVIALLLLGTGSGVTVAILNTVILELRPGPLPTGPIYNLLAIISMFLGINLATKLGNRLKSQVAIILSLTLLGAISRTAIMTIVNAVALPLSYPIGFNIPYSALPGLLALIGIFNFTISLYTIPIAYFVKRAIMYRYQYFSEFSAQKTKG